MKMYPYFVVVVFSPVAKADLLADLRSGKEYKKAASVLVSKEFQETEQNKITTFTWHFINSEAVDDDRKERLFRILERNSFVEIKSNYIFEADHVCWAFVFDDPSKNFAIMVHPSAPVKSAEIYKFILSGKSLLLTEKLSPKFLGMDLDTP